MIIMSFGYAFHSAIGYIVSVFGGPNSTQALTYGVSIIPVALCMGMVGVFAVSLLSKPGKLYLDGAGASGTA